jgi:hypothetical protein
MHNQSKRKRGGKPANRSAAPKNPPESGDTPTTNTPNPSAAVTPRPNRPAFRRRKRPINWIAIVGGISAVALIGVFAMNISRQFIQIDGVQTFGPFAANIHVSQPVTYDHFPPTGGAHFASWQNCGIYNRPIQDELAVHSLEHGAVWLAYQPDLPVDEVERLKNLVRGRSYTLMSPYANMDTPIAISAWGVQLTADSASDPRLEQFVTKYRQGAQTPEPGAACVGGQGAPDER